MLTSLCGESHISVFMILKKKIIVVIFERFFVVLIYPTQHFLQTITEYLWKFFSNCEQTITLLGNE